MLRALFMSLVMWVVGSQALVLEDLIEKGTLQKTIGNKKICYYPGSFDPLHLGHEAMVKAVLDKGVCDLVIVFPALGNDDYKTRTSDEIRTEMLLDVFKDNPKVIVTKYNALELQKALLKPDDNSENMVSKIEGVEYMGVVGSDTANSATKNPKYLEALMRGKKLSEKHKNTSAGTIAAIPATSFVVGIRKDESIENLNGMIGDRKIIKVIHTKGDDISSSKVKKLLKDEKDISRFVSKPVLEIIKKNGLYGG